ncbi:hypothetical protein E4Z66_13990 [Aliishimia ponticola]|uniref:DUF2946 domain-containing protein n=1 Tax=Aliishimia ponticola TaxID=2499833 RepID=A0A4S4NDM4_9RHOB|nr:hypothetical protein [Aliishimia ponticola]THH36158.1 hypothetical protein E4Z66_13990 [Aliishimia ponticola]
MKTVLSILFGFVLVLTAQGAAVARVSAPADGQIVLCTGHGTSVIYVDADGRPTSPPQLCFDAAQALFVALSVQMPDMQAPSGIVAFDPIPVRLAVVSIDVTSPQARGPPPVFG